MSNNKISGSYIIQCALPVAEYTFTGAERNAEADLLVTPTVLNFIDLSNGSSGDRYIDFLSKNKIHVKAIRIITPGGEGLRTTKSAAWLYFNLYENTTNKGLLSIIEIAKYNEWQVLNDYWEPYKLTKENLFNIGLSNAKFWIDDYNVQTAYIGEKVKFKIELSIDTAGLVLDNQVI